MKFIEVCAGAGGMSSGFIKANMSPLLLSDNNKDCCETLRKNHKDIPVECVDMKKLNLSKYKNKVDVLCGGIPCQSWSTAGNRGGTEDERGHLIYTFKTLVIQCLPKIFVIENVKGMTNLNNGEAFKEILHLMSCDGLYDIKYKVLNANDYDVAQKRERLFIVGIIKSCKIDFEFPKPLAYRPVLRDVLMNVPPSPGVEYSEKKKNIFKLVPEGGCWIHLPIEIQKDYLGKSFYASGGKRGIAKRLSMSEPSLTLLCSPQQKQTDRCHPTETRPLTSREYARIQSFPDDYEFSGSLTSIYKQIGNAVPVNLAYHLGKSLSINNLSGALS